MRHSVQEKKRASKDCMLKFFKLRALVAQHKKKNYGRFFLSQPNLAIKTIRGILLARIRNRHRPQADKKDQSKLKTKSNAEKIENCVP